MQICLERSQLKFSLIKTLVSISPQISLTQRHLCEVKIVFRGVQHVTCAVDPLACLILVLADFV